MLLVLLLLVLLLLLLLLLVLLLLLPLPLLLLLLPLLLRSPFSVVQQGRFHSPHRKISQRHVPTAKHCSPHPSRR